MTVIFVTRSLQEALILGDRVVVLGGAPARDFPRPWDTIAVLLTVFAAWIRIGDDLLTLLTLTLYPASTIALLPLLILWFDTSPTSLVVDTVWSVTLPTAINLNAGSKSVNPTIKLVGQNLGLRG